MAEQASLDLLLKGDYSAACDVAVQARGATPFSSQPSGVKCIFEASPKILHCVAPADLQVLRVGAAMMQIWGTNRCKQWMPPGAAKATAARVGRDFDVAARMVLFCAQARWALEGYASSKVVAAAEWLTAPDSCAACAEMKGRRYLFDDAPQLPHAQCTHAMGCRCCWVPVVELGAKPA